MAAGIADRIRAWISQRSPGQVLLLYYAVAILLGSFALSLPAASNGAPLPYIDALFTATSAQCVTGLVVVDTGSALSLFGQLVVLTLIQIGGLGITTFSVYLFFYLRLGVGTRGRWMISETLLHTPVESLKDLVSAILATALAIEAAGAILLSAVFVPSMGLVKGVYCAAFHSISAFCNAGFSLFSDSLVGYQGNVLVNLTIMALIVTGGIGFLVIRELMDLRKLKRAGKQARMSLHTKLVLATTAVLLFGGALLIWLMERAGGLSGMTLPHQIMAAFFQSVTARTAGFNTVDLTLLRVPTLVFIVFLMFVGASPGSAGGGIKTTSLALFYVILRNRLKGSPHNNIFHRTVPEEVTTKALSLVMIAILFVGLSLFALLIVQHPGASASQDEAVVLDYLFEAVSAFGTVGLSLGTTADLNVAGKIIVILLMYGGRVGLLTMAFAITRRVKASTPRFAEENVMIG